MDHANVMNSCDAKAQRFGLATLSEVEQIVVLVSTANFEISLGGLYSFYYNSAGNHAIETVGALEAVGAVKAAKALQNANSLFPGGPSGYREMRFNRLLQLGNADAFAEHVKEFFNEDPDVFSRLCSYMDEHKSDLAEHT